MVTAYVGLCNELTRISNNYTDESKYWFKGQLRFIVDVAKYLCDIDVLTQEQFDTIDDRSFEIFCRFDPDKKYFRIYDIGE